MCKKGKKKVKKRGMSCESALNEPRIGEVLREDLTDEAKLLTVLDADHPLVAQLN